MGGWGGYELHAICMGGMDMWGDDETWAPSGGTAPLHAFVDGAYSAYCTGVTGAAWGDNLTLHAVAGVFRCTIRVWSSLASWQTSKVLRPLDGTVPGPMELLLGHYHELHYASVEPA